MTVPGFENDPTEDPCPDLATLDQFAQLTLPSDVNQVVSAHVHNCRKCQSQLDQRTDSSLTRPCQWSTFVNSQDDTVQRIVHGLCEEFGVRDSSPAEDFKAIRLEASPKSDSLGMLRSYSVLRELGSGATATVFEAIDTKTDQRVAIKFIRSADEQTLRRVQREARAISEVNHENIVSIRSVEAAEDGRVFFVMPLVEGTRCLL